MARGAKNDYFGLSGTELKLNDDAENASIQTAEAEDERGDTTARATFESLTANSNTYSVIAAFDVAAGLILGTIASDIILSGWDISTSAGTPPSVSAKGESVVTGSTTDYTYTVPAQSLLPASSAQILFTAFTLSGEGCNLTACNASCSCSIPRAKDENGETAYTSVAKAQLEVTAEFIQNADVVPTVTPSADWTTVSPLTLTSVDEGYQTHSITLRFTPTAVAA